MKRLLIALILAAFAMPALAEEPVTFRPITGFTITSITTASASTSSKAFEAQTRRVRVVCEVNCFIAFPTTPIVASLTAPMFMPALVPEYFNVTPGAYVQVYADSQSGDVHVTEVGR